MAKFFSFGEKISEYDFKVINEREARASAGIMFLLGLLSMFSVYMNRTLFWAELFSITFILEFYIRVFVNPKYAPYMLIGSFFVANQKPEWVQAKPKKFAWILGMLLGTYMTYFIVYDIISPMRLGTCLVCLVLLYLESVFGICLGCLLYKKLNFKVEKCPGDVCETSPRVEIKKYLQAAAYIVAFLLLFYGLQTYKYEPNESRYTYVIEE